MAAGDATVHCGWLRLERRWLRHPGRCACGSCRSAGRLMAVVDSARGPVAQHLLVEVTFVDGLWCLTLMGQQVKSRCSCGGMPWKSGSTCRHWCHWNRQCCTTRRHAIRTLPRPSPDILPNSRNSLQLLLFGGCVGAPSPVIPHGALCPPETQHVGLLQQNATPTLPPKLKASAGGPVVPPGGKTSRSNLAPPAPRRAARAGQP